MTEIQKELFSLADTAYRDFHSRLIPTVPRERIIGVRTPVLREYASGLARPENEALRSEFLDVLPHEYYDENNLHAFLIEAVKDYDKAVVAVERFLPYIDNWATCDMFSPRSFAKNKGKLKRWCVDILLPYSGGCPVPDEKVYTVRFAVNMLMKHFLGKDFDPALPEYAAALRPLSDCDPKKPDERYYLKMSAAWYFATALAANEADILPYFTERRLDGQVMKMAVRKSLDSRRVPPETKALLRSL